LVKQLTFLGKVNTNFSDCKNKRAAAYLRRANGRVVQGERKAK
jgi:hypothetical protein